MSYTSSHEMRGWTARLKCLEAARPRSLQDRQTLLTMSWHPTFRGIVQFDYDINRLVNDRHRNLWDEFNATVRHLDIGRGRKSKRRRKGKPHPKHPPGKR